ncbi:MAG: hypothetical protein BWZ03_00731 [bacterium ADurb.BinA186]|nr:MAG: hypothetical protein BWZ03_00731 [bacterium ADurb.BinA186]
MDIWDKESIKVADENALDDVINAFECGDEDLSDWERDFIESVQEQWEDYGWLTDKQLEKILDIWRKI